MNERKKSSARLPLPAALLLAAALVLLALSGVQTARAALTYQSEHYAAQVEMYDIGITLLENGRDVSWRNYEGQEDDWDRVTGVLLGNMLQDAGDTQLKLGKAYPEAISVRNSGTIDEYVRVQLYTYWQDEEGNKLTELDPSLIDLNVLYGSNGWLLDQNATTAERTVLYYTRPLAVGEQSPAVSDTLTVSSAVQATVTETRETDESGRTTITTTYAYNGVHFVVEAACDGVQTHNAKDAIKSAWGVDVTIDDNGTLALQ